mmetsp:Transcript_92633/g.297618  ORF Transcript_92633/g.297618 Transcript_92633/m.297618 type:complete len:234 (+) Transcript_92633:447-1148(+)
MSAFIEIGSEEVLQVFRDRQCAACRKVLAQREGGKDKAHRHIRETLLQPSHCHGRGQIVDGTSIGDAEVGILTPAAVQRPAARGGLWQAGCNDAIRRGALVLRQHAATRDASIQASLERKALLQQPLRRTPHGGVQGDLHPNGGTEEEACSRTTGAGDLGDSRQPVGIQRGCLLFGIWAARWEGLPRSQVLEVDGRTRHDEPGLLRGALAWDQPCQGLWCHNRFPVRGIGQSP